MPVDYEENINELNANAEAIKYFMASGIPYYERLMEYKRNGNLPWEDIFNEFYKIQGLSGKEKKVFFQYFAQIKFDDNDFYDAATMNETLNTLSFHRRHDISFISKILHTYVPDKYIIYDTFVHQFFNPIDYQTKGDLYRILHIAYNDEDIRRLANLFDQVVGNGHHIESLKKIDFMIWGWGKWKRFEEKYPHQP